MQQTPNPEAHDPALRPPLLEHSSLNAKIKTSFGYQINYDHFKRLFTVYSTFHFLIQKQLHTNHLETEQLGKLALKIKESLS